MPPLFNLISHLSDAQTDGRAHILVSMWLLFCSPYCSYSQVAEKLAT